MSEMSGKVAVITGAAGGMGRVAAGLFARRGVKVVVADLDADGGASAVADIRTGGGEATFVRTDVSVEADAMALVQAALDTYGRLDYAMNNAAVEGEVLPLAEQPTETFRRVIDVNLAGVFFGLKHQIPALLRQGGGAIVNVASIAGVRGHPGLAPYVASKHAVNGLTKTAAIEYGARGVRVNSLCPGGILTPQLQRYLDAAPDLRAAVIDANPMRRLAAPEEMAEAAVWLCSPAASYVNGHELVVDGGKIASDV